MVTVKIISNDDSMNISKQSELSAMVTVRIKSNSDSGNDCYIKVTS